MRINTNLRDFKFEIQYLVLIILLFSNFTHKWFDSMSRGSINTFVIFLLMANKYLLEVKIIINTSYYLFSLLFPSIPFDSLSFPSISSLLFLFISFISSCLLFLFFSHFCHSLSPLNTLSFPLPFPQVSYKFKEESSKDH